MNITIKNRKKYQEYAKLLWEFAYAANYLDISDKKQLSIYPLISKCFDEYYAIQNITNPWEFDWENTDIENMVHPGDYFIEKKIDSASFDKTPTYELIKVVDIVDSQTSQGEKTKSVKYQTMHISKSGILTTGENIGNVYWGNHNEDMFIKPFCAEIFDGVYKKIDKATWDETFDVANSISEKYNKCSEIWK